MIKLVLKLTSIILVLVLLFSYTNVYANVVVTEENLNEALQSFVTSEQNDKNYEITLENNIMTIKVDEETYQLNYDLTGKPTFSLSISVDNNMEYAEFKEKLDSITLPMIGYVGVAKVQGIEPEDSLIYIAFSYLSKIGTINMDEQYVIVDDTNLEDGVEIDKSNTSSNTIYVSEFKGRAMEYINSVYKDVQTSSDEDTYNTYEWKVEKKNVTDSSCDIVSTLTVNTDADFSKISDYADKVGDSIKDQFEDIGKDLKKYTGNTKKTNKKNIKNSDDTVAKISSKLPQTGLNSIIITIIIALIAITITGIKSRKYKDIK